MNSSMRLSLACLAALALIISGCGGDDSPADCDPQTCESLGYDCDIHDDGCGGTIDCGVCDPGLDCVAGVCTDCVPHTCDDIGAQCDTHPDSCGGTIDCGECADGEDCRDGVCVEACIPMTCQELGYECGRHDDECGGTVNCGSCGTGYSCDEGVCVPSTCEPATCQDLGVECGVHDDECGGTVDCGDCPGELFECQDGACVCVPRTCEDLGRDCDSWPDGCGGSVNCGTCPEGETCRFDGVCVPVECVPVTCEDVGAECGTIQDTCGGTVDCGDCPDGQICGGDGPNQCGDAPCTPDTCDSLGYECGSHTDGCGGLIECGPCAPGERCDSNYQCVDEGAADGDPCTTDDECAGGLCISEEEYGWRDGYCTGPCETDGECGQGAICSSMGVCLVECGTDNDCRGAGYMCVEDDDGRSVCEPGATGSGDVGDPCEEYWDCGGREFGACLGWPDGYCTIICDSDGGTNCPTGSECWVDDDPDYLDICIKTCTEFSDCRLEDGYTCWEADGTMDWCIPGCDDHDFCDPYYCDPDFNICVECVEDHHCASGQTCVDGWCEGEGDECDIDGYSSDVEMAEADEDSLFFEAWGSETDPPSDDLIILWGFEHGNLPTVGTHAIELDPDGYCEPCVFIYQYDTNWEIAAQFLAIEGDMEITELGGDGETFAGTLHDVLLLEWDGDDFISGGLGWCIDGYSWSTILDGDIPIADCTSDADCAGDLVCDTSTGQCVECLTDGDCGTGEECVGNSCVPEATGDGELGDACADDADCGGTGGFCYVEDLGGWEGGYCFQEGCSTDADCDGGLCFDGLCWAECAGDSDCRDGYACDDWDTCYPYADGFGDAGTECDHHRDCDGGFLGFCWTEAAGFQGGYCSAYCGDDAPCPGDGVCITGFEDGHDRCLQECSQHSDCRDGYYCLDGLVCYPDTLLEESLRDGEEPEGWTSTDITWQTGGGGYAWFTSTDSVLMTPVMDLADFDEVTLEFDVAKYGSGGDGPLTVQVSTDGGTTWTAQEFDSPVPTDSSYLTSGPTQLTTLSSQTVIRFVRENSPSGKRLRDVVLRGQF